MDWPTIVEEWEGFRVVRDDLVPGGTKRRVIHHLFDHRNEYVYAGPCQGYAQVALAYACQEAGKQATLFCAKRAKRHRRTDEAAKAGAVIYEIHNGYLSVVKAKARDYCRMSGAVLLPFGLANDRMIGGIADVARTILPIPTEVWSVAGSGTLSLALQQAWPDAVVHAVIIGQGHDTIGRAKIWVAKERYEQPAKEPPPFPSCDNYDAKLWWFIKRWAKPGALVWNVAADTYPSPRCLRG